MSDTIHEEVKKFVEVITVNATNAHAAQMETKKQLFIILCDKQLDDEEKRIQLRSTLLEARAQEFPTTTPTYHIPSIITLNTDMTKYLTELISISGEPILQTKKMFKSIWCLLAEENESNELLSKRLIKIQDILMTD